MIQFQENLHTDGSTKDGRKDRQTLFYRNYSATTGGPKKQSDKKQHELEQQQIKQNAGKKRKKA